MAEGRFVSYLRVSTERQGATGNGIKAQREAVERWLNGGNWELVAEVVEQESGKHNDRPQLAEALRLCRVHKAKLLVAKLDRLSRNAAFLMNLRDSGVDFEAIDIPSANTMTIGVMALLAQQEREMISARTKAALAVVKQTKQLGGWRGGQRDWDRISRAGGAAVAERAQERAKDIMPEIDAARRSGATALRQIADHLNQAGVPTARGGQWSAAQVKRVLDRSARTA